MNLLYVQILIQVIVFLFAISVHESAHAWMALRNGDPTAYMLGRVTLNPIKHIDPVGTIIVPALCLLTKFPVIGWARPTPVNTRNFKHLVRSDILTSVAGPVSNLLVAVVAVLLLAGISLTSPQGHAVVEGLAWRSLADNGSALVPIALILYETMLLNVLLAVFNIIPVPPLDGSHVLRHFLPPAALRAYDTVGTLALIFLFVLGGPVLEFLFHPVISVMLAFLRWL